MATAGSRLLQAASVTVPASSANLGPAFDCAGLALELRDRISATPRSDGRVHVQVSGQGAGSVPRDERHLVARAARLGLTALGVGDAGFDLDCRNEIPHGRGLGSSAAAIVGGLGIARAMAGADSMSDEELLRLAGTMETHADNISAALLGGFTVAWVDAAGANAVRLPVRPDLRVVIAIPGQSLPTGKARAALPASVPLADAAFNAGRAALLAPAMANPGSELLLAATADRLHQDARSSMYPASYALMTALRGDGLAAAISGAGPTVLVLHALDDEACLQIVQRRAGAGWQVQAVGIASQGMG